MHRRTCRNTNGFTLIELMVAIGIMALIALMGWRALDGMQRANTQTQNHTDAVLALDAGLGQWGADLNALATLPNTTALDWDGRVLRMTRRHSADAAQGVTVVAWSTGQRNGALHWLRWQSDAVRTQAQWQLAWQAATLWAQSPTDDARAREVLLSPLTQWQIFYYRGNSWSNPLSASGANSDTNTTANKTTTPAPPTTAPDGVRLVLTLPAPHPLAGTLTRDWVQPTLGGSGQ
jgi:general secretion pathway protein J